MLLTWSIWCSFSTSSTSEQKKKHIILTASLSIISVARTLVFCPGVVDIDGVIIVKENANNRKPILKRKLFTLHLINLIMVSADCFLVLAEKA